MASSSVNLEDMYAKLSLTPEEEDGILVREEDVGQIQQKFVLVGLFLTDRNVNFQAIQNVLADLWRPKEGVEIHDLGGQRYSFVFYHVLDMERVIDGSPWTFEQGMLVYHKLEAHEDPNTIQLKTMDVWVQVYDLPMGMISEKIIQSIGNFVGEFVKADPANMNGLWKPFVRVRVRMNIEIPLKRRMKLKRAGRDFNWVNFKYERLSMFCFVCGCLGHSDRECSVVYANPGKTIERAYGVWLRAPGKNSRTQNTRSK
ncbi:uncharacterized protein LOC141711136 [Apium graveolens]|uniref:uncharacterized protein LOC141711136 n=1 Tax=Apium graveolens TaxID=4045 RepID=UPI003D78DE82